MLAIGNHLSGRAEMASIQTADLLNLHAEESLYSENGKKHFDPFDSLGDPFAQAPFTKSPFAPAHNVQSSLSFTPPNNRGAMSAMAVLPPPPGSHMKPSFTDTFRDSFTTSSPVTVTTASIAPTLTTLVPPPKSPKLKSKAHSTASVSKYSTIRPRKKADGEQKSANSVSSSSNQASAITLLPPMNKQTSLSRKSSFEKSPNLKLSTAIPRPTSVSSNASSSSPRVVANELDSFDSQPFAATFSMEASNDTSATVNPLDIFTELDPLGTGRSRPYVDKKDFFQDLKKPPKKRLVDQLPVAHNEAASKTETLSTFAEDPFGSLHFVPVPEPSPFDTKFAIFSSPLLPSLSSNPPSAPPPSSPPPPLPPPPLSASVAVAITGQITAPIVTCVVNPPVSVSQAAPLAPPPSSCNSSSGGAVARPKTPLKTVVTCTPGHGLSCWPSVPPSKQQAAKQSMSPQLPRVPLRVTLPQSDSDSEMLTLTARKDSTLDLRPDLKRVLDSPQMLPAVHDAAVTNGQDYPVPPLELSSSEEDSSSSEEANSDRYASEIAELAMPPQPPPRPPILRPPPLPPKGQQPPLLAQRPLNTQTEEVHGPNAACSPTPALPIPVRKPKMSTCDKIPRKASRDVVEVPTPTITRHHSTASAKLNEISLGQLSNMSLAELAATLQLPPARLACMTLTELALRLAELNKADDSEESSEGKDKAADEDDAKADDAEVCYKGGKKYEILSNTQEMEQETDAERAEAVEPAARTATSTDITCQESQKGDTEDKYAALREIMEQDLAVGCGQAADTKESFFDDISSEASKDFVADSLCDIFQGLARESPKILAFDDDFNRADIIDDAFCGTGARPKTSQLRAVSISSGSADFDPFGDDDFRVLPSTSDAAWNVGSLLEEACREEDENIGADEEDEEEADDYEEDDEEEEEQEASVPDEVVEESVEQDAADEEIHAATVDEFADKFAAFEARFPANPIEGFSDSFGDFDISTVTCNKASVDNSAKLLDNTLPSPRKSSEPFADFDSAFGQSLELSNGVKKSESVNIFSRVEDPFDDDFFQSEEPVAAPSPAVKLFANVVEDPFAWVQPFDDDYKFDEDFDS